MARSTIHRSVPKNVPASSSLPRRRRRPSTTGRGGGSRGRNSLNPQNSIRLRKGENWYGVGTQLLILESQGTERHIQVGGVRRLYRVPARRPRHQFVEGLSNEQIARWMSALAHPQRVAIVKAVFCGAVNYGDLRERVPLKAGPMYHHLRELRLAGVLTVGTRDVYQLTPIGRNLLIVACSIGSIQDVV